MDIGWPEIAIIAVVVLILFGSKKMPDAARSLGRSMRILKSEVKGMHDDERPANPATQQSPQLPAAPPTVQPAVPPAGVDQVTAGDRAQTP